MYRQIREQNDKIVLLANSNRVCKVSVKMPWGAPTKTLNLKKIEMQGTVLATLKCSVSNYKVGKEALEHMHSDLYKCDANVSL